MRSLSGDGRRAVLGTKLWPLAECHLRAAAHRPPCSRPGSLRPPCRARVGLGVLAPGHVHSVVAGRGCATAPRCPSSGLRPRVLAFSVPAPLGACIPERWCAEYCARYCSSSPPTPPLSEAARPFLALLSGCFLGHNTGILLWTCPSPCCSGTFQAPTHLSSAHITWLPGCPAQHLRAVMQGFKWAQAPSLPRLCCRTRCGWF